MCAELKPQQPWPSLTRRGFLQRLAPVPPVLVGLTASRTAEPPKRPLRFGVIADIHPDMLPDGLDRVRAFVAAMMKAQVDFIVQLGDFVWPAPTNRRYLDAWNAFAGPRYHVLGNHDMDDGYTSEQTVAFCAMPGRYYAFPAGPARGLVLDGNEPGGKRSGYRRFVGAAQLAWLERELAGDERPCVIFIHQPFDEDHADALENGAAVRAVLERAQQAKPGSVLAVFCGHLHLDYARAVNGIQHLQINSAAYWWLNNPAARRETYPAEVHRVYRYASHVAAYRDPLWAVVTLDVDCGELIVEGRRTDWIGPDPWTRGEITDRPGEHLHPWISDRRLKLTK
jgi:3',5'-cyclic AMP phosphodiesterase CpdA